MKIKKLTIRTLTKVHFVTDEPNVSILKNQIMTKLINNFNVFILLLGMTMLLSFPLELRAESPEKGNPTATITGVVTSETGEAVPFATVAVKDGNSGASTDMAGAYSIEAAPTATLVFSFIGYKTQEVAVDGRTTINVVMIEDSEVVEELLVIGYGTVKKSHSTGSVSKVKMDKLDQVALARVDDALVGQVAGVNIQGTNPAAGEAPTITIRGAGSLSYGSTPLVVVDGMVTDEDYLGSMDMNDIESIEVLKDAASSSIYGSRGANGVIMITTKQGKEGPVKFSYNNLVGFKSVKDPGVLTTTADWLAYTRANNDGELTDKLKYVEQFVNENGETDWHEEMMDGGMIQNHSLSARGGTKNTKFNASMSYANDEGVLLTDNFDKLNFRLNLKTKVNDRVSFGLVLNPSRTTQRQFPVGVHDGIRQHSWLPTYLDATNIKYVNRERDNAKYADAQIGDYAMERMFDDFDLINQVPVETGGTDISGTSNQSALAKVLERKYIQNKTKLYANTYINVNITDDLFFKQKIGGDYRSETRNRYEGTLSNRNGAGASRLRRNTREQLHYLTESTLNYSKQLDGHEVSAVVGTAYEHWDGERSTLTANGFENDFIQTAPAALVTEAYTDKYESALVSYLSRVNYAYQNKYLVSISARWDGSSKFGPDNKFGFFPAAALGWVISQEDFLKDSDLVDNLKLRASYGITGRNAAGEYDYIGLLEPVSTGLDGTANGFNPINIANSELRWEKLIESNIGLDASFSKGRFGVSVDVYDRVSEDLLLELPVPSVTGFEEALVNKGVVSNKGIELEFRSQNITGETFTWSTIANLTHNNNTLVDFAGASGQVFSVDAKRPAEWLALEGQPISSFYGYVVDKEIPLENIKNPFYPINGQSQDIYVKDLNGDGLIDTDDRTILGSPYPDFVWSVTNTFSYKDFDFSFMFQGSHGAEVRNISSQYIKQEFSGNQDYITDDTDAGYLTDPENVQQRIFTSDDIQDASYVSLRNLNLGYSFDRTLLGKAKIQKLRVFVGAQNLLYIMSEGYEGYNPEGVNTTTPLTYGYQRGVAPIYRTVSAGLNLTF